MPHEQDERCIDEQGLVKYVNNFEGFESRNKKRKTQLLSKIELCNIKKLKNEINHQDHPQLVRLLFKLTRRSVAKAFWDEYYRHLTRQSNENLRLMIFQELGIR